MRRRGGIAISGAIVAALLVGACTSGDDPASEATTESSAPTSVDDVGTPDSGDGDGTDDGDGGAVEDGDSSDGATGESGAATPLPGLAETSDDPIPNDPAVRTGVLDNGLTYYVRENDNPGAKADLRLAVAAGSVDELDDVTGVAHFVEHMLFNGTEQFPENELVDTLRSFGAAFGADINAYTSFDETVYTLSVPNADESVETGLNVLEQWLSHATIDDDQVVAERGVVLDEWRVRTQTTQGRLFDVAEELFLSGTPYEGRAPIGTADSIETMPTPVLREFYDTWYRPDNAAVIVVGDIDVDEIVGDIERLFGPATPADAGDGQVGESFEFGVDPVPDVGLHLDPDQLTVDVEVTLPLPSVDSDGTLALRAGLVDAMVYDALIRRLRTDIATGTAPFDDIARGGNGFVDGLDAPALYAFTDAERVEPTLVALLDEYERAARFGFTDEETELARDELRAFYDTRFEGRESTQDSVYASALVETFLRGSPYPTITDEYEVATSILDSVDADELGLRFAARWSNSAPHVIISAPESDADLIPSSEEVLEVIAASASREVDPRDAQRDLPDALMDRPEGQAPLVVESVLPDGDSLFDPVRLVYPNGVTVLLNSNRIVEAQVFFQAASPGGSSLVADDDVVDALYAADIVTSGGVADFNQAELDEITAGADVQVGAWIDPYVAQFAGSSSAADIEVLFQQLYLYMTEPRFDDVALRQLESRVGPLVDDPGSDARAAADDALLDARYPGELRYGGLPTPEEFATLELDGVERVWRDRFGDAAGWVFVLSGDIDIDEVASLADAYLGTLPSSSTADSWVDVGGPPPPGVVERDVVAGTGDTASVTMLFTSPVPDIDARLRVTSDVVSELIGARLTDVIREELGETYSPSSVSFVTTDPDPVIETYVFVTGSPERVDAIADIVVAEFDDLGTNGPSPQEYSNAYAQVEEALNFVNNGAFVQELLDSEIHPDRELDDYLLEFAALLSLTADEVQAYVATHMPPEQYIQVTVEPR